MTSKIRETRNELGLTTTQVFNKLGIPVRTQQEWESGRRSPVVWLEPILIREYHRIAKEIQGE